jgi:hypothetical protein
MECVTPETAGKKTSNCAHWGAVRNSKSKMFGDQKERNQDNNN